MSVLQVIFALISVILIFVQCKPTAALWDRSIQGDCWSPSIFYGFNYWVSAYTTMTDIILAIVPITVFWKLQMHTSTKLGVCIMMGLTLLSAIVTIVKATYLHLFTDAEDPCTPRSSLLDNLLLKRKLTMSCAVYNVTPLVVWGLIEQNVVIVAACIPTLRPFFRRAFESRGSSNNKSRGRSASAIKLSSNPTHVGSKRLPSVSELPLGERNEDRDRDGEFDEDLESGSHSSQRGIWQTREVIMKSEYDDERADRGRRGGGAD
jgi:hypothetical protein